MAAVKILDNIYWVGAVDWNIRSFHGHTYTTPRGTTYNAYLIIDEKITLIDTVHPCFTKELIENIKQVVPLEKIDYIIANHVETDHSGALPEIMELCSKAKIFGTAKCKDGLYKHYYKDWDFKTVKTGDKIDLGKRSLTFLEAPMLHWPDSMFTYCPEEELLLPNDGFGQHYATSGRFDDDVNNSILMDEAAKYYANILWPFSNLVLKKIEQVQKLNIPIKMIAPSHGIIWRKDPAQIIQAYVSWAKNETGAKAVIVYETMWDSTAKMARKIADGLIDSDLEVSLFDINQSDPSEIINQMLTAKGFIIGSATQDNNMLPRICGFLHFLQGLKPKNRQAAAFGSYGWAGGAVTAIEKVFERMGIEAANPGLGIQYVPDEAELSKCFEFGKDIAQKI